jgi:uroporphyrinogen-III decarboxylase
LLTAVFALKDELDSEVPVIGGIISPLTITAALLDIKPIFKAGLKRT